MDEGEIVTTGIARVEKLAWAMDEVERSRSQSRE
jgi:hypothetical protein